MPDYRFGLIGSQLQPSVSSSVATASSHSKGLGTPEDFKFREAIFLIVMLGLKCLGASANPHGADELDGGSTLLRRARIVGLDLGEIPCLTLESLAIFLADGHTQISHRPINRHERFNRAAAQRNYSAQLQAVTASALRTLGQITLMPSSQRGHRQASWPAGFQRNA